MIIDVIRPDSDLARKRWSFRVHLGYASNMLLVVRLESYAAETRPSRKHRKWTASEHWPCDREYYYSGSYNPQCVKLPKPESVPDDVLAEVKQRAMAAIEVEVNL